MDIEDFVDSFYEEAEELLEDMEQQLLELDPSEPDTEQLNAIFRAAHSIKGGAGAFGFSVLQETTHVLENRLDDARQGQLVLTKGIIDLFLRSKDVLADQLGAYRAQEEPDAEAFASICQQLQELERGGASGTADSKPSSVPAVDHAGDPLTSIAATLQRIVQDETGAPASGKPTSPAPASPEAEGPVVRTTVTLCKVNAADRELLLEELKHFGQVLESGGDDQQYDVLLETSTPPDAIEAVLCFIVEPHQLRIETEQPPADQEKAAPEQPPAKPAGGEEKPKQPVKKRAKGGESASIRVAVDKVDRIINLVGELVITQSMLEQQAATPEAKKDSHLIAGLGQLKRNARDLQEEAMSIRMLPMDHVFSRFPRQVRDLAGRLNKEVELITEGESTELDRGLIEHITDPLTHLVRNSLDHGIEPPDQREAAGKPRTGRLLLSARQQGGNIIIEVVDDGAGLSRDKILKKAKEKGLDVSDEMPDEEVWQLLFAPGFSTADQVSNVSGRGVGMDVVKRNIQEAGGHVEVMSSRGEGTTTRIVLPLTLAILDGMSVRVGQEMFVLPLGAVSQIVQPKKENLYSMAGDDILLKVRDDYLPVVALHEVMGVPDAITEITESIAIGVQGGQGHYALLVDQLVDQQQIVVKNLENNYRKVPGVSAATILGDGRVALILDTAGLYRHNQVLKKQSANAKIYARQ